MNEEYYSESISTFKLLDRFSYKGRGRPRKSDYIAIELLQKKLNKIYSNYMNRYEFKKQIVCWYKESKTHGKSVVIGDTVVVDENGSYVITAEEIEKEIKS